MADIKYDVKVDEKGAVASVAPAPHDTVLVVQDGMLGMTVPKVKALSDQEIYEANRREARRRGER